LKRLSFDEDPVILEDVFMAGDGIGKLLEDGGASSDCGVGVRICPGDLLVVWFVRGSGLT